MALGLLHPGFTKPCYSLVIFHEGFLVFPKKCQVQVQVMRITLLNHEKIEKYKDPCFGAEGGDQLNLTGLFFLFK
jgi:hypothetical protein